MVVSILTYVGAEEPLVELGGVAARWRTRLWRKHRRLQHQRDFKFTQQPTIISFAASFNLITLASFSPVTKTEIFICTPSPLLIVSINYRGGTRGFHDNTVSASLWNRLLYSHSALMSCNYSCKNQHENHFRAQKTVRVSSRGGKTPSTFTQVLNFSTQLKYLYFHFSIINNYYILSQCSKLLCIYCCCFTCFALGVSFF